MRIASILAIDSQEYYSLLRFLRHRDLFPDVGKGYQSLILLVNRIDRKKVKDIYNKSKVELVELAPNL
jgi:hypothetical protein